jgi:hypothetical protein
MRDLFKFKVTILSLTVASSLISTAAYAEESPSVYIDTEIQLLQSITFEGKHAYFSNKHQISWSESKLAEKFCELSTFDKTVDPNFTLDPKLLKVYDTFRNGFDEAKFDIDDVLLSLSCYDSEDTKKAVEEGIRNGTNESYGPMGKPNIRAKDISEAFGEFISITNLTQPLPPRLKKNL